MRVMGAEEIGDRLELAGFEVQGGYEEWSQNEYLLLVTECDRDELKQVLDALAAGYSTDISMHESGYEVMLQEEG